MTDPIENMLASAEAIVCAFAKASIVDREALLYAQESNEVMTAFQSLRLHLFSGFGTARCSVAFDHQA